MLFFFFSGGPLDTLRHMSQKRWDGQIELRCLLACKLEEGAAIAIAGRESIELRSIELHSLELHSSCEHQCSSSEHLNSSIKHHCSSNEHHSSSSDHHNSSSEHHNSSSEHHRSSSEQQSSVSKCNTVFLVNKRVLLVSTTLYF